MMIQKLTSGYEMKIIDFGHARFSGEAEYGYLDSQRIKKYPQIDPLMANGGPCNRSTDLYAVGILLQKMLNKKQIKCPIFEVLSKSLLAHECNDLDPRKLMAA